MNEIQYYNQHGKEVGGEDEAWSRIDLMPHNFNFYIKKTVRRLNWKLKVVDVTEWVHLRRTTTMGSWMWPEGLPLVFDNEGNIVDPDERCLMHAEKIGSVWF